MARLVLIDGNSIAFRAFYALPPLTDRKGRYTQVPYGFSLMLFHLLERGKPDFLAVAFDAGVPVFRQEAYEAYKATRERAPEEFKEQLATLRELLDAFGIRWLELSGFEADDVIGTLAREARTRSLDADILSSDRDLLQLLEPSVRVGLTRKGVTEIEWYDEARFREEYGFPRRLYRITKDSRATRRTTSPASRASATRRRASSSPRTRRSKGCTPTSKSFPPNCARSSPPTGSRPF